MNARDLYVGTEWSEDPEGENEEPGEMWGRINPGGGQSDVHDMLDPNKYLDSDPSPEEDQKDEFLSRPPALGFTEKSLQALRDFDKSPPARALPRDKNRAFELLRSRMLRQCVACDGASTITGLADALEVELRNGTPSRLPTWYKFSKESFGPRRLGLWECSAKGCFRVETEETKMKKCAGCHVPQYCGKDCQAQVGRVTDGNEALTAFAGSLHTFTLSLRPFGARIDSTLRSAKCTA